jgi:DnaJ-class molecular chaperone
MTDYEHGKLYVYDATSQTFDLAVTEAICPQCGGRGVIVVPATDGWCRYYEQQCKTCHGRGTIR